MPHGKLPRQQRVVENEQPLNDNLPHGNHLGNTTQQPSHKPINEKPPDEQVQAMRFEPLAS